MTTTAHRSITPAAPAESAFELYDRIEPVAIVWGSRRLFVTEYQSARRLLLQLWKLGRAQERIRGMICAAGAVPSPHLAALNCFLQHSFSAQSMKALRAGQLHRFTWSDLRHKVPIVFHR